MDPKIRDRTYDELLVRKIEFLKICNILDELNIIFFLNSSILLGAIRDNNFIKWDWDIEISVFSDDLLLNIDLITNKLKENSFEIKKINKKKNDSKLDFVGEYPGDITGYTIWSWNYSKFRDVYWRRDLSIPSKFLKKFSKIDFMGRQFNCPYNPEEYLEFAYGNWKVPLRSDDKELYNTKAYKNKIKTIIMNSKNAFKKIVYELWKFIKK